MDGATLTELFKAGGLLAYCVISTWVVVALWNRLQAAQDKLFDVQQTTSKELRETQAASHTALAANTTALASMAAAMQTMGRGQ